MYNIQKYLRSMFLFLILLGFFQNGFSMKKTDPLQSRMVAFGMAVQSQMITIGDDTTYFQPDSVLIGTGSISGHIFGLDSLLQQRIEISAFMVDTMSGEYYKGYTRMDSTGTYEIGPLSPGFYHVYVWANGYLPQFYDGVENEKEAKRVEVIENGETSDIDFYLEKLVPGEGIVSGYVTDQSGNPLDSVYVYAWDPDLRYNNTGNAFTNAEGYFEIKGLASGQYYVQASAQNYMTEWFDDAANMQEADQVSVDESGTPASVDFQLGQGGTITGQIYNADDTPAMQALVEVYTSQLDSVNDVKPMYDPFYKTQVTDSMGNYEISFLREGAYYVKAYQRSPYLNNEIWYEDATTMADATPVEVIEDQITSNINMTFHPLPDTSTISGVVTDNSGTPVRDAYIQLRVADHPEISATYGSARTDSSGHYVIPYVRPGLYYVECGYFVGRHHIGQFWRLADTLDDAEALEVVEGNDYTDIDFVLPFSHDIASVQGTVRNSDGHPIANTRIRLYNEPEMPQSWIDVWTTTLTDSDGHYSIKELPVGTYWVQADYFDWQSGQMDALWYENAETQDEATAVTLQKNETRTGIDFELNLKSIYGSVSGTVVNQDQTPLAGAYVQLHLANQLVRNSWSWAYEAVYDVTTNDAGQFVIDRLPEGDYKLAAYANGGYAWYSDALVNQQAEAIHVKADQDTSLQVQIKIQNLGTGTISGTVTSSYSDMLDTLVYVGSRVGEGVQLSAAVVMAKPSVTIQSWPESERFYCGVTDTNGVYTIPGLPDGEYLVSAFAANHLMQYYDGQYVPEEADLILIKDGETVRSIDFHLYPALLCWETVTDKNDYDSRGSGEISGSVTDGSGTIIGDVTIYLFRDNQPIGYVQTDSEGQFKFNNLPTGNYTVQANKAGVGHVYLGGNATLDDAENLYIANNSSGIGDCQWCSFSRHQENET